MKLSDIPSKFQIPFADAAGGGYIRTIPQASQIGIINGAASLTDGFPPSCFQPVGAGGTPPWGQDFNGILNQITAWSRWQGGGGPVVYDSSFSTAVGGYPQGAIVASATNSGVLWLCLADNNTTNPDSSTAANWASLLINIAASGISPIVYVRTDGNDSNSGNTNTAGGAMATIAAAITRLQNKYYLAGGTGIIQLGNAGIYTDPGIISVNNGQIQIIGDVANQANYIIRGSGPSAGNSALLAVISGSVSVKGITISNLGTIATNHSVLAVSSGSSITLQNVSWGTATSNVQSLLLTSAGGSAIVGSGCIFGGSANWMLLAQCAVITLTSNITITNNPSFSTATASAIMNGTIITSSPGLSISGSAVGIRYNASLNGVINTSGGGANFFPGSIAGSTSSGGQYA